MIELRSPKHEVDDRLSDIEKEEDRKKYYE